MKPYCYITFSTTFSAIRAEEMLKSQEYIYKMVPVPRSISSSCGTALNCHCEHIKSIKLYLKSNNVEMENYYQVNEMGIKTPQVKILDLDKDKE